MKQALALVWLLCAAIITSCNNQKQSSQQPDHPAFAQPAVQQLTARIEEEPENARLYYERGLLLDHLEADSLAIDDLKKAISLDSNRAEYYSAVGDILISHKDITGSVDWFLKAVQLNPKDPKAHLKTAQVMYMAQNYKDAFAELNTVLRQDVFNPEAYFWKGMIYKELKDTSKAISSFQTSLNVDPNYRNAAIQLAQIYAARGNDLCLQYYDNAFRMDSTDVFPIYAKGRYYQDREQLELAKQTYRQAILRDHQYADAYLNTGFILLMQDSVEKAFRQFDLVVKNAPTDPHGYYDRGLCHEKLGRRQDAINDYQQALVFDRNFEPAKEALQRLEGK